MMFEHFLKGEKPNDESKLLVDFAQRLCFLSVMNGRIIGRRRRLLASFFVL
jgi:hypothetical protein